MNLLLMVILVNMYQYRLKKLYALGKDYADQRKQAEKELETNIKKFGEFVTPSSVNYRIIITLL